VGYPSYFNIHNYLLGPSHRRVNDLLGHVFEFEGRYHFCDCWSLGLDLKYTIYASKHHGKYHPDFPLDDYHQPARVAEARVINVQWESFAILLSLNYEF
jgi:Protochlamydia outer membrane protein